MPIERYIESPGGIQYKLYMMNVVYPKGENPVGEDHLEVREKSKDRWWPAYNSVYVMLLASNPQGEHEFNDDFLSLLSGGKLAEGWRDFDPDPDPQGTSKVKVKPRAGKLTSKPSGHFLKTMLFANRGKPSLGRGGSKKGVRSLSGKNNS
jgi:hypothetical protein